MKRTFFLFAIVLVALSSCQKKKSFVVRGLIKGEAKDYIYLDRVDVDTPVLIDSAKIRKNGSFRMRIRANAPDFYQLGYSSSDFISLLASPGEKIILTFEGDRLYKNYTVTGSEETRKIKALDDDLMITARKLDSLSAVYNKASSEPDFEKRGAELEEQFMTILKAQRKRNIEFIIKNTTSLASIKAVYQKVNDDTYVLYDPKDLQYMKILNDSLSKYFPRSKHVQALASDFSREMEQMYANRIRDIAQNIPETKLDPDLKTIDGKRITLSSLRGKYVLLTFWSVGSRACIEENLQLKEYYKLYNRKGFEIYQINLDGNEEAWKNAVRFDELPWINTREDNPQDPLYARLFNVKTLPANYLFDREGNIIAKDLHGKNLQIKLNQLFN